jgi:GNAT superfamily N-acetyltransferase
VALTPAGEAAFADLDARSSAEIAALVAKLQPAEGARLAEAMATIETLVGRAEGADPVILRDPRPGDLGWVVHRHGALYAAEYGWDASFEGLVASIVGDFTKHHDPARERCWIAEHEGAVAGSVMLVRESDAVAKLRILYVEPSARGLGIGRRLVDACTAFAREAGYSRITLWTNDVLVAARRLYEQAGYVRVKAEPHRSFGHDLVGETWELALGSARRRAR